MAKSGNNGAAPTRDRAAYINIQLTQEGIRERTEALRALVEAEKGVPVSMGTMVGLLVDAELKRREVKG